MNRHNEEFERLESQAEQAMQMAGIDGIKEMMAVQSAVSSFLSDIANEVSKREKDLKNAERMIYEKKRQLGKLKEKMLITRDELRKQLEKGLSPIIAFYMYLALSMGCAGCLDIINIIIFKVPIDELLDGLKGTLLLAFILLFPIPVIIRWSVSRKRKKQEEWQKKWDTQIIPMSDEIRQLEDVYKAEDVLFHEIQRILYRLKDIHECLTKRIYKENAIIRNAEALEMEKRWKEKHDREVCVAAEAFNREVVAARNVALNNKEVIKDLIEYIADLYVRVIEKQFSDNYAKEIECSFSFTVLSDRITFQPQVFAQDGKSVDTAYRFTEHRKANLTTLEEQQGLAWALMVHVENEMRVRRFWVQAERNQITDEQKWSRKNIEARIDMNCSIRNPYFEEEKKMV